MQSCYARIHLEPCCKDSFHIPSFFTMPLISFNWLTSSFVCQYSSVVSYFILILEAFWSKDHLFALLAYPQAPRHTVPWLEFLGAIVTQMMMITILYFSFYRAHPTELKANMQLKWLIMHPLTDSYVLLFLSPVSPQSRTFSQKNTERRGVTTATLG